MNTSVRLVPASRVLAGSRGSAPPSPETKEGTLVLAPADTEFDATLAPLAAPDRGGPTAVALTTEDDRRKLRGAPVAAAAAPTRGLRRLFGLG